MIRFPAAPPWIGCTRARLPNAYSDAFGQSTAGRRSHEQVSPPRKLFDIACRRRSDRHKTRRPIAAVIAPYSSMRSPDRRPIRNPGGQAAMDFAYRGDKAFQLSAGLRRSDRARLKIGRVRNGHGVEWCQGPFGLSCALRVSHDVGLNDMHRGGPSSWPPRGSLRGEIHDKRTPACPHPRGGGDRADRRPRPERKDVTPLRGCVNDISPGRRRTAEMSNSESATTPLMIGDERSSQMTGRRRIATLEASSNRSTDKRIAVRNVVERRPRGIPGTPRVPAGGAWKIGRFWI